MFISAISLFIGSWLIPSKHTMGKTSGDNKQQPAIKDANLEKMLRQKIEPQNNAATVLRVHNPGVLSKDINPDTYLDFIKGEKLDEMLAEGIKEFIMQKDLKKAWLEILTNYKKAIRLL